MTANEAELVFGHKAIASLLGLTPRQAMHHDEKGRLPTFRVGRRVAARRAALIEWAKQQETAAQEARR